MQPTPRLPPSWSGSSPTAHCSGNPGPGGWAFILQHPASGHVRDASGAEPETTNNRMELAGVIEGLATLTRRCQVELVDRQPVRRQGYHRMVAQLEAAGMACKEKGQFKPVMNADLWKRLDVLLAQHDVRVTHVLGHRGHPENEACDRMAVEAYKALTSTRRKTS